MHHRRATIKVKMLYIFYSGPPPPRRELHPASDSGSDMGSLPPPPTDPEEMFEEGDEASGSQGVDNMVIEERIATFFEERPYFYDQAHDLYKNRQRKNSELDEFARKIGWTAKQVWTRFTSNRTDHGKLKNPRATKCGQAPRRLTLKQKFKLERYAFLDAYMKPRSDFEVMGKLPGPKGADEDDDDDDDAQDEAEDGTSIMARAGTSEDGGSRASSVSRPKQQQKRKKQPVADLLTEMLKESREKEAEVAKKMEAALQGEEVVTERTAWGRWLASTAQTVPGSAWRDYQRDMFAVAMRYMPVTAGDSVLTADPQPLPQQPVPQPPQPLQPLQHPLLPLQQPLQQPLQHPVQQPLQQPLQHPVQQPLQQPLQHLQQPMQRLQPQQTTMLDLLMPAHGSFATPPLPQKQLTPRGQTQMQGVPVPPRAQSAPAAQQPWDMGAQYTMPPSQSSTQPPSQPAANIITQAYVAASDTPAGVTPSPSRFRTSLNFGDSLSTTTSTPTRVRDSSEMVSQTLRGTRIIQDSEDIDDTQQPEEPDV